MDNGFDRRIHDAIESLSPTAEQKARIKRAILERAAETEPAPRKARRKPLYRIAAAAAVLAIAAAGYFTLRTNTPNNKTTDAEFTQSGSGAMNSASDYGMPDYGITESDRAIENQSDGAADEMLPPAAAMPEAPMPEAPMPGAASTTTRQDTASKELSTNESIEFIYFRPGLQEMKIPRIGLWRHKL